MFVIKNFSYLKVFYSGILLTNDNIEYNILYIYIILDRY
jgi:hypothetical protein